MVQNKVNLTIADDLQVRQVGFVKTLSLGHHVVFIGACTRSSMIATLSPKWAYMGDFPPSQAFCLELPTISWSQISIRVSAEVLDVLTERNWVWMQYESCPTCSISWAQNQMLTKVMLIGNCHMKNQNQRESYVSYCLP